MNCKFHPTAEAVTTCVVCGAEMCSSCDTGTFFYSKDDKPFCLECSLKAVEDDLADKKYFQKGLWIKGIIASIIWFAGLALGGNVHEVFYLLLLVASIFLIGLKTMLPFDVASDERGFLEKLKAIIGYIIFCTILLPLLLPFMAIYLLICNKMRIIKANRKVKKIKATLDSAN